MDRAQDSRSLKLSRAEILELLDWNDAPAIIPRIGGVYRVRNGATIYIRKKHECGFLIGDFLNARVRRAPASVGYRSAGRIILLSCRCRQTSLH